MREAAPRVAALPARVDVDVLVDGMDVLNSVRPAARAEIGHTAIVE
jgi:hypothetical protein